MSPIFLKNIENSLSSLNSEFIWDFELNSRPSSEFKLFKDNKEIKLADRIFIDRISTSTFSYGLNFRKVEATDMGVYKIVATNKCGTASTQATLSVSGAPIIVRKPNAALIISEKKPLKVEFEVNGLPLPEIEWFRNHEPLISDARIKLDARLKVVHTLAIDSTNLEDATLYTFKAKNDSGEVSESFNLSVQSI